MYVDGATMRISSEGFALMFPDVGEGLGASLWAL